MVTRSSWPSRRGASPPPAAGAFLPLAFFLGGCWAAAAAADAASARCSSAGCSDRSTMPLARLTSSTTARTLVPGSWLAPSGT